MKRLKKLMFTAFLHEVLHQKTCGDQAGKFACCVLGLLDRVHYLVW